MAYEDSALATQKITVFKIVVPEYFKGLYLKVLIWQIGHQKILICYYVMLSWRNDSFTIGKIHKFFFELLDEIFLLFRRVLNGTNNHNIL